MQWVKALSFLNPRQLKGSIDFPFTEKWESHIGNESCRHNIMTFLLGFCFLTQTESFSLLEWILNSKSCSNVFASVCACFIQLAYLSQEKKKWVDKAFNLWSYQFHPQKHWKVSSWRSIPSVSVLEGGGVLSPCNFNADAWFRVNEWFHWEQRTLAHLYFILYMFL